MILPLALILCFMVGCQDKEAMAELEEFRVQAAVEEQNKEVAKHYFEEMNKGNAENNEVFKGLHATEFSHYFPSNSPKPMSLEEMIESMKPYLKHSLTLSGILKT